MPPPDFGARMSKDRFTRWMRYLSEGPENASTSDPWREVRWLIKGHNANRKATIKPSWLVVVDETMWAWTGQGMPHLSTVPRKPEPLGAEVKNLCDGLSGVMLFLELQEGKIRMANKKFCDLYKATTANTLRLAEGAGLMELGLREEDKVARLLVGDSWFASTETATALMKELGVHFVGNVKTATRGFPIEQLRWGLSSTQRGDHVVCKLEGEDMWAVGWNDHHFKTFVVSGGATSGGINAKRKRQDTNGKTFYKEVKRPRVLQHYYAACGGIDQHNNFRQGQLRLEKFHQTRKWNARVFTSTLSSKMVDAHRACEYHFPTGELGGAADDLESGLKSFVAKVIDEISPAASSAQSPGGHDVEAHRPVLIGKYVQKEGKDKGKIKTKVDRCTMCQKRNYRPDHGRAPRTAHCCAMHPKVFLCAAHKGPCIKEHQDEYSSCSNDARGI